MNNTKVYKVGLFNSSMVTQQFYKEVAEKKGEVFNEEQVAEFIGYEYGTTTPNQDKKISDMYNILNGIGVSVLYDEQGEFVKAEIPTHYQKSYEVAMAGHKQGESNALH